MSVNEHDEYPKDVNRDTFSSLNLLLAIASAGREITDNLRSVCNIPTTRGICLHSAILMRYMMMKYSHFETTIRGGDGEGDGGYRDENGVMHGHYWNEVKTPGGTFIFDLTADQFAGGTKLGIFHLEEPPAQNYVCGNQLKVDAHVQLEEIAMLPSSSNKIGVFVG